MAKGEKTGGRDFQPGESGNPNGRPKKGESLTDVLKNSIDKEEIAERLLAMAREDNLAAIKYIYDRIDGKPTETQKISGDADNPLSISVQVVRPDE